MGYAKWGCPSEVGPTTLSRGMRLLLGLLYVALTPGLVLVLVPTVEALSAGQRPWRIGAGLALGVAVHWAAMARLPGVMTLGHELKHVLIAVLFLRRVRGFSVTWRQGGVVQYSGRFGGALGDHAIGLAPYFLMPLSLMTALALPLAARATPAAGLEVLFGLCLAVDLLAIGYDLRRNFNKDRIPLVGGGTDRTDIGKRGYLFSVVSVVFFCVAGLLVALTLVGRGYAGILDLGRGLGGAWVDTGAWIVATLQST